MLNRDVVSNDFPGHQETNGQGMKIFFLPSCRPGRSPTSLETALDIQRPEKSWEGMRTPQNMRKKTPSEEVLLDV